MMLLHAEIGARYGKNPTIHDNRFIARIHGDVDRLGTCAVCPASIAGQ